MTAPGSFNSLRDWLRLACVVCLTAALLAAWVAHAQPLAEPKRVVAAGGVYEDDEVHVELEQLVVTRTYAEAGAAKLRTSDQPRPGFVLVAAKLQGWIQASKPVQENDEPFCQFSLLMRDGEVVNAREFLGSVCRQRAPLSRWITFELAPSRVPDVVAVQLARQTGPRVVHLLRPPS